MYRGIWVASTLLIILVLAMITGFQPLYWLVYIVVAGTAIGYLLVWLQSRGLHIQVQELSPHPQVGQTVRLRVTVTEKAGLPRGGLRARLVGDFTAMDEEDLALAPRGSTTWTVSGLCNRRGLNTIGSLAVVSSDPSGLLRLECRAGKPQSVLVYPATVEMVRGVVEGQATGGEIGEAGRLTGHSSVASMVRRYIPGDSLTHVHWPTTARLDQLMTKEFEGAGVNEIWLFVDLQETAQVGSGEDSTEEYSITMAASLASTLIRDGHAVGLVAQGDELFRLAPRKDPNHLWALLKALALVKAEGKVPLSTVMARETANLGPGTLVMVLSPWPTPNVRSVFDFLTRRGIVVMPTFLDPASFGRPTEPHRLNEPQLEANERDFVVKRGDELSIYLGKVMDRLASY